MDDDSLILCNVRSTPCSLVKSDEEWGELSACEAGDHCGSSHTRTEQQFHPEVIHSTVRLWRLVCMLAFSGFYHFSTSLSLLFTVDSLRTFC